jgi:hypothetical protein
VVVVAAEEEEEEDVAAVLRAWAGMSRALSVGLARSSVSVKLKSGGRSRPLGRRIDGSRSSSKNGWAQHSIGLIRLREGLGEKKQEEDGRERGVRGKGRRTWVNGGGGCDAPLG